MPTKSFYNDIEQISEKGRRTSDSVAKTRTLNNYGVCIHWSGKSRRCVAKDYPNWFCQNSASNKDGKLTAKLRPISLADCQQFSSAEQQERGAIGGFSGVWIFEADTSAPPSTEHLRFDNTTYSSVTNIYVHDTAKGGIDFDAYLDSLDNSGDEGVIRIFQADSPDAFWFGSIQSSTDNGAYHTLAVTHVQSNGQIIVGKDVGLTFAGNGEDGTSGTAGSGGSSGTSGNGTSGTSGNDGTDGTSGNDGTDGTSGTSSDYAELISLRAGHTRMPVKGDVVIISPTVDEFFELTEQRADPKVAGVFSSDPGFTLNIGLKDGEPLAVAGQVLTNVDARTRPIKRGDLLQTSPLPGYGERADHNPKAGTIFGKAMESLEEGLGQIKVLANICV